MFISLAYVSKLGGAFEGTQQVCFFVLLSESWDKGPSKACGYILESSWEVKCGFMACLMSI